MTNKEFLTEVQKSCHIENAQCVLLLNSLQKVLAKAAVDQVPVVMPGLGVFTSHKHPEYIQEDQQTGAMTLYPPRISYRMQTEMYDDAVQVSVLLSEFGKISDSAASAFIASIVNTVNETLVKGEMVEVPFLGSFARVMTHNSELQHVEYTPDEQMKELVNAPFSCFEPVVISEGESAPAAVVEGTTDIEDSVETEENIVDDDAVVIEDTNAAEETVIEEALESGAEEVEEKSLAMPEIVEPKPVETTPKRIEKTEESSDNKLLYASVAVVMIACGLLVWLLFRGNDEIIPQEAVVVSEEPVIDPVWPNVETPSEDTVVIAEPEKKPAQEIEPKPVKQEVPKEFHRMKDADGNPVMVKLQAGERLTLIALNHFGDKAFWPYVFDANSDKLKAPNLVQAGMMLYLPDPVYYGIDANDPESLRKAKNRGAQLLNK